MGIFDTTASQFASRISSVVSGAGQVLGNVATAARNIGVSTSTILGNKPDGTSILANAARSILPEGVANVLGAAGALGNSATFNPAQDFSINPDFGTRKKYQVRGKPNILENFASYNCLFTFAAMTKDQLNNPFSYRSNPSSLKNVVFSSAGRFDSARVPNAYGLAPEYFVNNFTLAAIPTANNQNGSTLGISYEFEVYEPYSMGQFLASLQTAALNAGQPNYLSAPYVMMMEFVGFTDDGKSYQAVKPKFFIMKLRNTTFKTDEGGSRYQVQAIPFNHEGFGSVINMTYNDVAITGETVKEVLITGERSLCIALNEQEVRKVSGKQKEVADVYEVHFPNTPSDPINLASPVVQAVKRATADPKNETILREAGKSFKSAPDFGDNPIGGSKFGFTPDSGGTYVFSKASDVVDANGNIIRDQMTIDPKKRTFQFAQGQTLTAIISQLIISSEYAFEAVKEKNWTPEGFVKWFRVDCQVQLTEFDVSKGIWGKRIIYRVLPYLVHSSVFTNTGAVPLGYAQLAKSIIKEYNYIYTGQNNDVLKFDIEINSAFFNAIAPTPPQDSGKLKNPDLQSGSETDVTKAESQTGTAGASATAGAKTGGLQSKPNIDIKLPFGGSGNLTTEQIVANNFHRAFLENVTNMVNINIEVLGDPFWITDSGVGGYFAGPGESGQITIDNTANYEGGDTYIFLRFRTPIEPRESDGIYQFPKGETESPFSGIYKVTKVQSSFRDNVFRQAISAIRMPYQVSDFDKQPTEARTGVAQYALENKEKPPETIYGDEGE